MLKNVPCSMFHVPCKTDSRTSNIEHRTSNGFTFIEAIITLGILAGGILGVLTLYQQNIAKADEMEQTLIATALAQEKLEQIIQDKKYNKFASIIQANYPSPENLATEGYPQYTRTITIQDVSPTDLTSPPAPNEQGAGYKRITVGVQVTGGPAITFVTLLTEWGEL